MELVGAVPVPNPSRLVELKVNIAPLITVVKGPEGIVGSAVLFKVIAGVPTEPAPSVDEMVDVSLSVGNCCAPKVPVSAA